ncbi:aldo/keto reductase [Halopseudomonas pelagia]|uniref:Aldo/keto reductase n=1 Tax=Halopseudomonas pelagia TaxID=553151 RepID=A0AA91U0Z4_9GAMM|nr:aldo/keto reductase [Halopseudomonas pelagia]PCC98679.1 oxidoreductase [Halopseudomonas pelagia]QFY56729.1 aldo/keto reductase [Halopseudomonas pelagia]
MQTISLGGVNVPRIGQGTWRMGEDAGHRQAEVRALREGLDLGMTLIDTAEMYAEGGAEEIVGDAIRGRRDEVYLVSKVYPHNASAKGVQTACERSLQRLGTETIDLYLLHWRGQYPLDETVAAFERLREQGKILRWGVSNFDVADLQELDTPDCATNQVLYNPESRGIEYDLLGWHAQYNMPIMAYCPIGQGGALLQDAALQSIADKHDATPAQIALAWVLRHPGMIAIPKAVNLVHLKQNAGADKLRLDNEDLARIDAAYPPPTCKQSLEMV